MTIRQCPSLRAEASNWDMSILSRQGRPQGSNVTLLTGQSQNIVWLMVHLIPSWSLLPGVDEQESKTKQMTLYLLHMIVWNVSMTKMKQMGLESPTRKLWVSFHIVYVDRKHNDFSFDVYVMIFLCYLPYRRGWRLCLPWGCLDITKAKNYSPTSITYSQSC